MELVAKGGELVVCSGVQGRKKCGTAAIGRPTAEAAKEFFSRNKNVMFIPHSDGLHNLAYSRPVRICPAISAVLIVCVNC